MRERTVVVRCKNPCVSTGTLTSPAVSAALDSVVVCILSQLVRDASGEIVTTTITVAGECSMQWAAAMIYLVLV